MNDRLPVPWVAAHASGHVPQDLLGEMTRGDARGDPASHRPPTVGALAARALQACAAAFCAEAPEIVRGRPSPRGAP